MKSAPDHNKAVESAKDQGHSNATTANREARRKASRQLKQAHKKFVNQLFPTKVYACFECKKRLTDETRKRMATFQKLPKEVIASGFQLCMPCADLLQSNQWHRLPNVNRDLLRARFQCEGVDVAVRGHA
ncbi:hypothetical protein [Alcaligenes faecalis]|uniref:hypothetical protein n=1 Tax=Alcaligenes faecalis TaxID=511 RepID=UPI0021500646|nr:hypothetical protein [Alcaligenes faecalis]MCR4143668.1 hypothetical protein [Alcaligenes faecalis]WGQ35356.1 hypothetical protein QEZ63_16030 [Alcaligenes faecalis]